MKSLECTLHYVVPHVKEESTVRGPKQQKCKSLRTKRRGHRESGFEGCGNVDILLVLRIGVVWGHWLQSGEGFTARAAGVTVVLAIAFV